VNLNVMESAPTSEPPVPLSVDPAAFAPQLTGIPAGNPGFPLYGPYFGSYLSPQHMTTHPYARPPHYQGGVSSAKDDGSDEDSDRGSGGKSNSTPDRTKKRHNESEQRRRDKINQHYDELKVLLPAHKNNKSAILSTAAEYIRKLQVQCEQLESLNQDIER